MIFCGLPQMLSVEHNLFWTWNINDVSFFIVINCLANELEQCDIFLCIL